MSFRLKTILGIAFIEAVLLAVLIGTSLAYLRESNEAEYVKRAHTAARLFATTTQNAVLAADLAALEDAVREMLRNPGIVYARVRGRGDLVLAEAGAPELLRRPFHADSRIGEGGDEVLDVAEDLGIAGTVYGRVEIGVATGELQEVLHAARQRVGAIALLEMVLVALFSLALGSYLTRGLASLRQASRHIAAGDLDFRVEARGTDELADTARAFNDMSHRLQIAAAERQRAEAEVARYRDHLEQLVTQRTEALTLANETLREANHQLAQARSQLIEAERMASLGQLAAGVAHEINNPLGYVSANLGSLERYISALLELVDACGRHSGRLDAAEQQRMDALRGAADLEFLRQDAYALLAESREGLRRVKRIVEDLRGFACAGEVGWQPADLHRCLDTTLELLREELAQVTVVKEYGRVPEVECLGPELSQVFANLLRNAAQATEKGGTVTLRTGVAEGGIWVEVADTGCGIPPENLPRVFDPFFTTRPVGKGAGLGLSVAYGIVQRHHGRLGVESTPGKGSTFRLWLPCHQPCAREAVA